MYYKTIKNSAYWLALLLAGAVILAFGVIGTLKELGTSNHIDMLLGMFCGLGGALVVISVIKLLYMRFAPAKKLKQEEIMLKDERNIQILRASYTVANVAATLLFAVMAFLFVWLGYIVPGLISAGALILQVAVFIISYAILSKKM